MPAIAGFQGRVFVGAPGANPGTVLRAYHWSVDYKVDEFDVTTFENFGFGNYIPGLADVDVTFDAYYDPNDNPFQAPLDLQPGTFVSVKIAYQKASTGNGSSTTEIWEFSNLLITSVHNETGVRDVIRYSVSGKAAVTAANQVDVPAG